VTPLGAVFSKEEYLGAVAAGILHYLAWELDSPIDVRMYHDVALIRYRAQIEIEVQGQLYPRAPVWFTDAYEKRRPVADRVVTGHNGRLRQGLNFQLTRCRTRHALARGNGIRRY
jgi:hypothetical protein